LPVVVSSARMRSPTLNSSSLRRVPLDVCTVVSAVKHPPVLAACDDSAGQKLFWYNFRINRRSWRKIPIRNRHLQTCSDVHNTTG
jgi:hypothetical protein